MPATALAGYAAGYLVWRLTPVVTGWTALIVGLAVCGLSAWRLSRRFAARAEVRQTAEREAQRAAEVAETERQLAAMRYIEEAQP